MENPVWLFAVAGGAGILGLALAFGMMKQEPRRSVGVMAGAFIVAAGALGLAYVVRQAPETAPSNPPDAQGTQYEEPARPSDQNALPGLQQPNR